MTRTCRELSPEVKEKISASMRNRSKSYTHRMAISKGMKEYWKTVPYSNNNQNKDPEVPMIPLNNKKKVNNYD